MSKVGLLNITVFIQPFSYTTVFSWLMGIDSD